MSRFSTSALALVLIAGSSAANPSMCADAAADTVLPPGPYCPGFKVTPAQQRAIFERFTRLFLVTGQLREAFEQHVSEDYIQHNPFILSGRKAIFDAVGGSSNDTASNSTAPAAKIITQSVDSERGIAMFHYWTPATPPATQPSVTVDIFRMNGSCIQEHWDVSQDRPADATNPLAMFSP